MLNVFSDTRELDKKAIEKFLLTEDVLMENAALALESEVLKAVQKVKAQTQKKSVFVLIVTGSGDNGGDGMVLARRLVKNNSLKVAVFQYKEAKSKACIKQKERAIKSNVQFLNNIEGCDILVDCLIGSGFHGELDKETKDFVQSLNNLSVSTLRLSCDVPSGLAFKADITVTMGSLKTVLFSDKAKDVVGSIKVADLGISRSLYENCAEVPCEAKLLETNDLKLPSRRLNNVHKGTFGHASIVIGSSSKPGAGVIAGTAALSFGAGLVTLVGKERIVGVPFDLMQSNSFPTNTTAIAAGMGLGRPDNTEKKTEVAFDMTATKKVESAFKMTILPQKCERSVNATKNRELACERTAESQINGEAVIDWLLINSNVPAVVDADLFYYSDILELLIKRASGIVLTPHPKEFASLLAICGFGNHTVEEIVDNRLQFVKDFCCKFPGVVLILKGANSVIGFMPDSKETVDNGNKQFFDSKREQSVQLYINSLGCPCLAKAGSGDVLSGLICALLAQGYSPLEAAINGSLAHAVASQLENVKSSYGMTPFSLIESVKKLESIIETKKLDQQKSTMVTNSEN